MNTATKTPMAIATATLVAALIVLSALIGAATADASFRIESFDGSVLNADGTAATQAGAHPYEGSTSFMLGSKIGKEGFPIADEQLREAVVDLPPGFVGNPNATPRCTQADFADDAICPPSTQVGMATMVFTYQTTHTPIYNMVPPDNKPAQFAFKASVVTVYLDGEVRPDDYGLTIKVKDISQTLPLIGSGVTFWGVPADPSHDADRGGPSDAPRKPFLSNPTFCNGPVPTTLHVASWEHPGGFLSAMFMTHLPAPDEAVLAGPDRCGRVPFDASLTAEPGTRRAATPTGVSFDLGIPQNDNPDGIAQGHLKRAEVTLPAGATVSASAAAGLGGCSSAQVALGTNDEPACPDSSKIGTAQVETPLLEHPMSGSIYLATPDDNPSKTLLAAYIVARGPGVLIKLPGRIDADPQTGQLKALFDNNPQLPFDHLRLQFKGGDRATLVSSSGCGTSTTNAQLTSWSGKTVDSQSSFTIDQNCDQAGRFEPTLDAGFVNAQAGGSSPFTLTLTRPDGQQDVAGLNVTMPRGVLGTIASVPLCAEGAAAAGACGAESQIGHVTAAAGAGPAPLSVPQAGKAPTAVYLAGPYKGAPFSLSIVVPAQAGPFDLGNVVVRAALLVDPIDAHVTVVSDPIPTILKGIPLDIQKLNVTIDRAGFMVSPTNCQPTQVGAHVSSAQGAAVDIASRFQVGNCASLAVKPKLDLTLSGKGQTTDGKHPAVTANLVQPQGGQANLKKVRVALPLSLALDPDNANGLCEFVDGSKVEPTCPKASIVGSATAVTPILDQPLSGPVYFVKNIRKDPKSGREIRTLPKLVIPLVGQNGVRLTLTGTSDVVGDRLVTTFDNIPDAPVSSFKLNIIGGKGGILTVSGTDICKASQVADQQIDGQNHKNADADVYIQTPSCPTKIISKTIGKTTVKLKIGGLGAGKVTVTGRGIKKTTKSISKSTVATITAKRTGKGKPGAFKVKFAKAKTKAAATA